MTRDGPDRAPLRSPATTLYHHRCDRTAGVRPDRALQPPGDLRRRRPVDGAPGPGDACLPTLLEFGVDHIDTAAGYGDPELRIAPWLVEQGDKSFLATKTDERTGPVARAALEHHSTASDGADLHEAAGGDTGLLRLAAAWHRRVLADESSAMPSATVSTLNTPSASPPTGPRPWADRPPTPIPTATRPQSCGYTVATESTTRWTAVPSPASTRP